MTLRIRIFIIVSLIILLILGISLFLINRSKNKKTSGPLSPTSTLNDTSSFKVIDANNFDINKVNALGNDSSEPVVPKKYTESEATQNSVIQLAKIFTERYGSYSTDNNSQNIREVQEFATKELWEKIKPASNSVSAKEFKGVSTQSLSAETVTFGQSEAVIKVRTIRIQEINKSTSTVQQAATVSLKKQGNSWLVSDFVWEK